MGEFTSFHHVSLARYESHVLHSGRGASSTVVGGGYVKFWSKAVKLRGHFASLKNESNLCPGGTMQWA